MTDSKSSKKLTEKETEIADAAFDMLCQLQGCNSWNDFIRKRVPELMHKLEEDDKIFILSDNKTVTKYINSDDGWSTLGKKLSHYAMIKTIVKAGSKSAIIFGGGRTGWPRDWFRVEMLDEKSNS